MAGLLRYGRWALGGLALLAYLLLAHHTTAPDRPSTLGALVATLPYLALALLMAWRSTRRVPALAAWALLAGALVLSWPLVKARFEWVYFIQHVGAFGLLTLGFARSLAPGQTAMITRFARLIHGETLPPAVARYTRHATLAWALFFAAMTASSAGLFALGAMPAWSLLVNLLTPLLVGAMFAAEFCVRLLVLPASVRTGLIDSVRACFAAGRTGTWPPPGRTARP